MDTSQHIKMHKPFITIDEQGWYYYFWIERRWLYRPSHWFLSLLKQTSFVSVINTYDKDYNTMPTFTRDEKALLNLLKRLYWANKGGRTYKCHQEKVLTSNWLNTQTDLQALSTALDGLINKQCITRDRLGLYCLTDDDIRAIGAAP